MSTKRGFSKGSLIPSFKLIVYKIYIYSYFHHPAAIVSMLKETAPQGMRFDKNCPDYLLNFITCLHVCFSCFFLNPSLAFISVVAKYAQEVCDKEDTTLMQRDHIAVALHVCFFSSTFKHCIHSVYNLIIFFRKNQLSNLFYLALDVIYHLFLCRL